MNLLSPRLVEPVGARNYVSGAFSQGAHNMIRIWTGDGLAEAVGGEVTRHHDDTNHLQWDCDELEAPVGETDIHDTSDTNGGHTHQIHFPAEVNAMLFLTTFQNVPD